MTPEGGPAPPASRTPSVLDIAQARLQAARQWLQENHLRLDGMAAPGGYARRLEALITSIFSGLDPHREHLGDLSILATGGFSRRELSLHSDLDLLFLVRDGHGPLVDEHIKRLVNTLWSMKLQIGHQVRTIDEVVGSFGQDIDSATTVFHARLLHGSSELAAALASRVRAATREQREWLVRAILEKTRLRHTRFLDAVFVLEPNLKESRGALRDLQTLRWLSLVMFGRPEFATLQRHGLLSAGEVRMLQAAQAFMYRTRTALHLHEGRATDQLGFESQIAIARRLGYEGQESALPEEELMRAYYDHTTHVDTAQRRLFEYIARQSGGLSRTRARPVDDDLVARGGNIEVRPETLQRRPAYTGWIMRLFLVAGTLDLAMDDHTLRLVTHSLRHVDDDFRASPVNRERFLAVLRNPVTAAGILRLMHQSRFLCTYLPEFALVRNLPRIDYYHQFTVDEHLLRSVACLADFFHRGSPFHDTHAGIVARSILRLDLLNLALLFHDVGKGEGRGHVIRGQRLIQTVAERLAMSGRETEILTLLVAQHQKMSHIALRRNIEDPRVAAEIARDTGEPEMLRMLYVLTCCDLRSVSVDSWNDWRASLLANLYERSMDVLAGRTGTRRDEVVSAQSLASRVMKVPGQDAIAPGAAAAPSREEVERFIAAQPPRYRRSTSPREVLRHIRLAEQLGEEVRVVWEIDAPENCNYAVLTSVATDTPGLFSHLCGALASRRFNILSAQVYTSRGGVCVDIFQIQDAQRRPPEDLSMLERLRQKLNRVLVQNLDETWSDFSIPKGLPVTVDRLTRRPPAVVLNNDHDDVHTVIEIKAPDRPGLLYEVTAVMARHGVHIHTALIATESYQVVDVFYVTDLENNKLERGARTAALERDILAAITPPPGQDLR